MHESNRPAATDRAGELDLSHSWVAAATIELSEKLARQANLRGYVRLGQHQDAAAKQEGPARIDVLDVYCQNCRRTYDDVADLICEARVDNSHLVGGHPGERQKRGRATGSSTDRAE